MATTKRWERGGNKHLDLQLDSALPYHGVIADLVSHYAAEGARVADIGCGLGHIGEMLGTRRPDLRLDVADAYESCLEATRSRARVHESHLIDELRFDVKDHMAGPYDVIVMSHVLEHLLFPAKSLDEVLSLLSDEGVLVVAVPNPVRPTIFLSSLLRRDYVNVGHVHAWDRPHWHNFVENVMGCEVLEHRADYVQLPGSARSRWLTRLGRALAKVTPWWSFSNISVLRRGDRARSVYGRWRSADARAGSAGS